MRGPPHHRHGELGIGIEVARHRLEQKVGIARDGIAGHHLLELEHVLFEAPRLQMASA
jgi:hypothetical protein